nr:reverse transcriptase domain-containing protein [Tanacetum cinerariifolium]
MDDEPMWAADRVVALTLGSTITIPETANEFAIKGNHLTLVKGNQFDGRTKTDPSSEKSVPFPNMKTNLKPILGFYKELQSRAKQPTPDLDDDDIPMSWEEEAKFMQTFSYLGASINLMPYPLYVKLSLKTLKPTKMSVRLAGRSFQYPIGIAKNMLVEVGKFIFLADFVILEMEEDSKVPLILGRPFLHTVDVVIRVKQKQLNLRVRTERMIFNIDSAIKHSYSNDDTCFSIDVIDEILEEYLDALLDEGSKILYSIKGTILEEEIFSKFDKFIAVAANENYDYESDEEEPKFKKITINTYYKIKTSFKEPLTDLELKPLPNNLEYVFLEEPSFLPIIISSQLSTQNSIKLVFVLKNIKKHLLGKQ